MNNSITTTEYNAYTILENVTAQLRALHAREDAKHLMDSQFVTGHLDDLDEIIGMLDDMLDM